MKKNIKKHSFTLFFIVPLLASCSLLEPADDNAKASADSSCERKTYQSLVSDNKHRVKGDAQIYTGSMQGEQTTNCDVIDMNGFTAAHPTLPLPSHIKITNTQTNKSVVVKVNDRSPSQQGAVLYVTPAVANVLGTTVSFPVSIEVIPTKAQTAATKTRVLLPTRPAKKSANPITNKGNVRYYIVVGTYAAQEEALAKFTRLSSIGIDNATMETRKKRGMLLHMVRIGPFYQQDDIDKVKTQLQNDGLVKFTVVRN